MSERYIEISPMRISRCVICFSHDRNLFVTKNYIFMAKFCPEISFKADDKVCWECEYIIRKIIKFKQKAIMTQKLLIKWGKGEQLHTNSLSSLNAVDLDNISYKPNQEHFCDNKDTVTVKQEIILSDIKDNVEDCAKIIKTEVDNIKIEYENYFDEHEQMSCEYAHADTNAEDDPIGIIVPKIEVHADNWSESADDSFEVKTETLKYKKRKTDTTVAQRMRLYRQRQKAKKQAVNKGAKALTSSERSRLHRQRKKLKENPSCAINFLENLEPSINPDVNVNTIEMRSDADCEYDSGAPGPSTKKKLLTDIVHKNCVTYSRQDFKPNENSSGNKSSWLNATPKSSAERGRDFRARQARLKQNVIVEIAAGDMRCAGPSVDDQALVSAELKEIERRAKAAEATRRWRQKKNGNKPRKQAKTPAQRMREYRERKKRSI